MNQTATKNKKDIFYIVVLILTFIAVLVGAAFAAYYYLHSQEEGSSAVYTGTLQIEYLSGDIINCNLLYPALDPTYEETENVYKNNFKVTNTGSLDSTIDINAIINDNEFSDETLKYKLFNGEGDEIEQGSILGTGEQVLTSNIELASNEVENFTLIIWLKETGENQNEEMKKTLSGTLEIKANQKID